MKQTPGALSFLAAVGLAACAAEVPAPSPVPTGGPTLSVLSYNINFEREGAVETLAVLAASEADVVVLQESTPAWEAALEPLLREERPHHFFRRDQPDGGMSIYSRFPLETRSWLPSPAGGFPSWCGDIESPLGALRVLAVHLHPPVDEHGLISGYLTTSDEREREVEAVKFCLDTDQARLVLGDFNEEQGPATALLLDLGFVDAAGTGKRAPRTWRWDTGVGTLTGRPDHIYVGPRLRTVASSTGTGGASDHLPLEATVRVGP